MIVGVTLSDHFWHHIYSTGEQIFNSYLKFKNALKQQSTKLLAKLNCTEIYHTYDSPQSSYHTHTATDHRKRNERI